MHAFESHRQWNTVQQVYRQLKAAGFQALLAGGCVRDLIMNRVPNDFDIATDAKPEAVEGLFEKALTVGREFGVTILPFGDFQVEVATFRQDGPYLDGRRPAHVVFCTPEEDAKRRDFTVNALFYDIDTKTVIDYVGGQADIQARVIRAVGEPELRFEEDKLRLLRAVRFAAQLEFEIEPRTLTAVKRLHDKVAIVSAERIHDEVLKLLKSSGASTGLQLMKETGLLETVFPEFRSALADTQVFEAAQDFTRGGSDPAILGVLRFLYPAAKALADKGPEATKAWLKRLRFSNQDADQVLWALKNEDLFLNSLNRRPAEVIRALAHAAAPLGIAFYTRHPAVSEAARKQWADYQASVLNNARELPARFLTGEDLQALGVAKGPALGKLLDEAFSLQLEGTFQTRDEALAWARSQIST